MNNSKFITVLFILFVGGLSLFFILSKRQSIATQNTYPSPTPAQTSQVSSTPSPYPDTQSAIEAFLANKYQKPVSEVHVTVQKEVPGFASGSVMFGQGGPGEGGMWLAVLGNNWSVVWDGNGNVDCNKMRQDYGFPDSILKPNFCN